MTIDGFFERCEQLWPGKSLTPDQRSLYGAKMLRFTDFEISKVFDWLSENSKFFPKVADIYESARHCGYLDRVKPYKPHTWVPNDCEMCIGSGMIAAFFEELYDPADGKRELQLRLVMQYQQSNLAPANDWVRYLFRCSCPRGDAATIEKGFPRWDPNRWSTRGAIVKPQVTTRPALSPLQQQRAFNAMFDEAVKGTEMPGNATKGPEWEAKLKAQAAEMKRQAESDESV